MDLTLGEPREPSVGFSQVSRRAPSEHVAAVRRGPAGGLFSSFAIQKKTILRPFLETTDTFAKKRPDLRSVDI